MTTPREIIARELCCHGRGCALRHAGNCPATRTLPAADAALSALRAAGYAVVPREPTLTMEGAGACVVMERRFNPESAIEIAPDVWSAMIAASEAQDDH